MIGAIIGDIVGSAFEWNHHKSTDFKLFSDYSCYTDDTVLTIATADAMLNQLNYSDSYYKWGRNYLDAGYGRNFYTWLMSADRKQMDSFGNGSAMRVSPVGWVCKTMEDTLLEAKKTAFWTHHHPDGIDGAQSVAAAIFLARTGSSKEEIKSFVQNRWKNYDLNRTIEEIRPQYTFDATCPGSVPEAMIAFLDSTDYESAIRLAVSLGGDSDTQACIAGSIAEAFYKEIPEEIVKTARSYLEKPLLAVLDEFESIKIR
ncbi:MAG: ADP-ribosylglycohydrolase family protein [Planctomycetia bacterium]|nr:ADP-ribosylglycohydrolase family protein [Planctomycetia bacterium]